MNFNSLSRCRNCVYEIALFLIAFAWGLVLLFPVDSFSTSKTYKVMNEIAPESIWGLFPVILLFAYFLSFKRAMPKKICVIALMLFWLLVSMSTFIANQQSTAAISYSGFALLTSISYLSGGKYAKPE